MSPQNSNVLCNLENFLIWFGGMPRNETQTHVLCQYVLGEGLASFQALTHPSIMEKQEGLVSFLTWAHKHGRNLPHISTFWGTIVVRTMNWACSQLNNLWNTACLFCKQWRGGQGPGNKARAMLTQFYIHWLILKSAVFMITSSLEEQQHSCSCSTEQVQVVGLQMRLLLFCHCLHV